MPQAYGFGVGQWSEPVVKNDLLRLHLLILSVSWYGRFGARGGALATANVTESAARRIFPCREAAVNRRMDENLQDRNSGRGPLLSESVRSLVHKKAAVAAAAVIIGLLVAVAVLTSLEARSVNPVRDPGTRQALLHVATQFNNNYSANNDGPVYDRWDSTSQVIITRAQYEKRHVECPTPPGTATVESASRAAEDYWIVRYSIDGVQLTDYWHYQDGKWRFDLARSNPDAVKLYRMSFKDYARAVGCVP